MYQVSKGTEYFLSEVGHYNFLYPATSKVLVLDENINVNFLNYVSGSIHSVQACIVLDGKQTGKVIWIKNFKEKK